MSVTKEIIKMYISLKVIFLKFCNFTKIYVVVNFYLSCLKLVVLLRSEFWCLLTILGKCQVLFL